MGKLVRRSSGRRASSGNDCSAIGGSQRRDVVVGPRMRPVVHVSTGGLTVSRRIRRVVTLTTSTKRTRQFATYKYIHMSKQPPELAQFERMMKQKTLLVGCSWAASRSKGWLMTIVPLGNSWLPAETSSWLLSGLARSLSCNPMGSTGRSCNLTPLSSLSCTGSTLNPNTTRC
jgi:hypothetical protein